MRSTRCKTRFAGALTCVAVAATIAAPVAFAMPTEPASSGPAREARVAPPDVPPPPSLIAASAGEQYEELRSPDTQDGAAGDVATVAAQPGGFDWVSAAIGAVAAAGLSFVTFAALGMRKPAGRRAARA
jgi:hypothetical protein